MIWEKQKNGVIKMAVACSTMPGERLSFDISSPSLGGEKHWILVVEDSTDFAWSYFYKKIRIKNVMMSLVKEFNQAQY